MTKQSEEIKSNKKFKVSVIENKNGFSLWVNGRWIVDASTFNEEFELSICGSRLKPVKNYIFSNHKRYKFVPDVFDKRRP